MTERRYDDMLNSARDSLEYWSEATIIDFTEDIVRLMDEKDITRADLARRIVSSQAYITKVLRGNANFTIETMTKLARALGAVVRIHLAPENVVVHWEDEYLTADSTIDIILANEIQLDAEVQNSVVDADARSYKPVINPEFIYQYIYEDTNDIAA